LIYFKAIFDAINEAMNIHRPLGLSGYSMPWNQSNNKIACPSYTQKSIVSIDK